MSCCHLYPLQEGHESAFSVDLSAITFGRGALEELGHHARALNLESVALFTDRGLVKLDAPDTPGPVARAMRALREGGVDVALFDEVEVEPTDRSFKQATDFARSAKVDGFVSVGGGSVIDTAKAANLYSSWPAELLTYVNAPIGAGEAPPGPLRPHLACPTTSGTGSECTGIAVFDLLALEAKTGIASPHLRPTRALIDPSVTATLPASVVASSGFDVLSHALESYTARPFTAREKPSTPAARPMSQGRNPWSELGCAEALRLTGRYIVRAVRDPFDTEARERMMWASTLAGIAFGNSGVHAPHGMAYSVAGLVRDFHPPGYPRDHAMVPHGMSVIVNAPAVFRRTAVTQPQRHLEAAGWLGAPAEALRLEDGVDAGALLAEQLCALMKACAIPNGLSGVGYGPDDIRALTEGAIVQARLLDNAPMPIDRPLLEGLYKDAMRYW